MEFMTSVFCSTSGFALQAAAALLKAEMYDDRFASGS